MRKPNGRKGFALVFCLSLMALVFALVMGLTSLVTLELRHAQMRQEGVLCRAHARFGLSVAMGELKRHAGPDQRVTASAALLLEDEQSGSGGYGGDGRRHWTGVWNANDRDEPPAWLVSERDADPTESFSPGMEGSGQAVLVGSSEGTGDTDVAVRLGKVEVETDYQAISSRTGGYGRSSEPETTGAYAYWVGDEGLKAKINMAREENALNSTGFGLSVIPGLETFESQVPAATRSKLLNEASVADATGVVDEDDLEELFHEVTAHGHGVLANVRGGGLRRDLTAGLQTGAKDVEGELVLTGEDEQIFGPVDSGGSPPMGGGYIPQQGFPELQGYEIDMGSWVGRLPFNPMAASPQHARRVALRESSSNYYCIDFEDWQDYDWDVRVEALRLSDGNIQLSLYHPSYTCFRATVYDNYGQPVQGLTDCRWLRGSADYRSVVVPGGVGNATGMVSIDPGGPLWDQLRDYYNLRQSGNSIAPRVQTEDKVGVHPVVSRAQFFLYPTYERESGGKYRVYSHVLPAIVLWNPHDVDLAPSKYTVGVWNRQMFGFGDKYRIYYNDRNVCEKNYYRWYPRKPGGPEGEILDQGRAKVDIKGKNPEPGYPNARWPYVDTDGQIGVDLIGPCRLGKIWTFMDTVPGETYEVRIPYGINEDDRPKPYVRRGIASWDGTDMATFEGNTQLFTYGTPQDYVTFSAVATSDRTKLELRSDVFRKKDGGGYRHSNNGTRTCQGVTVGICTVKSASGYPASVKIPTKYDGLMSKKIGFVLDNVSGLKAGEALVFTPYSEGRYAEYSIGHPPGNMLKEGWNGGHTFWKPTDKLFDADAKPTHAEVLLDQNDTYLALFKGAVDTDSSYNEPLLLLSMGQFKSDSAEPEQFPIVKRKSGGRYSSSELAGARGRRFALRYSSSDDDSYSSGRIRWLANYNPRASLLSPTPYEFSDRQGDPLTGLLQTIPNYLTDTASVSADEWDVPVAGSTSRDNPFVAYSHSAGVTRGTLFEIPKGPDHDHFRSLAQFSHVDFSTKSHRLIREYLTFEIGTSYEKYAMRGLGYKPGYAIGNSLADPRIPLDSTYVNLSVNRWVATEASLDAGYHYDHSYMLNEALWDDYFLSTVPRSMSPSQLLDVDFTLPNSRFKIRRDPRLLLSRARDLQKIAGLPALQAQQEALGGFQRDFLAFDGVASLLLLDGAFNVNSTSVHAWSALLGSFFGAKVVGQDGVLGVEEYDSPFLRMNRPHGPAVKDGDGTNSASSPAYLGYRVLSKEEIRELATEIVKQVRLRGPFRSLAEFVNRTLPDQDSASFSSDWAVLALKGALQAAIEDAGINDRFQDEMVSSTTHANLDRNLDGVSEKAGGSDAAAGPAASHVPGYLTQADLLSRLGPCLSARSDTFRVRVFGEAGGSSGSVQGSSSIHARCEAIFQRLPDIEENPQAPPGSSSKEHWNDLRRKFALVGFRWLTDREI